MKKDGKPTGRIFTEESKEVYYVVYPGSEKLDVGERVAITITRNKDTAMRDVEKYGEFGEVVVLDKQGLIKIIEEW